MTKIIRADTDQLRTVARQMRTTADHVTSGTEGMRQLIGLCDPFLLIFAAHFRRL